MTHTDTPESAAAKTQPDNNGAADAALYPIGRLAREAGVSTRTVRYYEEIGLLRLARRYAGGRRVFDGDALQRLHFISRLKGLGFSLEEIRHLNDVFELNRSTADMLVLLDAQLEAHLATLAQRMQELAALREDMTQYRAHIQARHEELAAPDAASQPGGSQRNGTTPHGRRPAAHSA